MMASCRQWCNCYKPGQGKWKEKQQINGEKAFLWDASNAQPSGWNQQLMSDKAMYDICCNKAPKIWEKEADIDPNSEPKIVWSETTWDEMAKKRRAVDRFQRLLDNNKRLCVQRKLRMQAEKDSRMEGAAADARKSSIEAEKVLLRWFRKPLFDNMRKVSNIPGADWNDAAVSVPYSDFLGPLLKGKSKVIPELHSTLRSQHHLHVGKVGKVGGKLSLSSKGKLRGKDDFGENNLKKSDRRLFFSEKSDMASYSETFSKMLKGKKNMSETMPAIKSFHQMATLDSIIDEEDNISEKSLTISEKNRRILIRNRIQAFKDKIEEQRNFKDSDTRSMGDSIRSYERRHPQLKRFSDYIRNSEADMKIAKRRQKHRPSYMKEMRSLNGRNSGRDYNRESETQNDSISNYDEYSLNELTILDAEDSFSSEQIPQAKMQESRIFRIPDKGDSLEDTESKLIRRTKAIVQSRIQELMKKVNIREDFRPPREPRNFVMENIQKIHDLSLKLRESMEAKKAQPTKKYQSKLEELPWPGNFADTPYGKSMESWLRQIDLDGHLQLKPLMIRRYIDTDAKRRWTDLVDAYKDKQRSTTEPTTEIDTEYTNKDTATETLGDSRATDPENCVCSICAMLSKCRKDRDSEIMKRAKIQRQRLYLKKLYHEMRERGRLGCPRIC